MNHPQAPHVPKISHPADTSNFDFFQDPQPPPVSEMPRDHFAPFATEWVGA